MSPSASEIIHAIVKEANKKPLNIGAIILLIEDLGRNLCKLYPDEVADASTDGLVRKFTKGSEQISFSPDLTAAYEITLALNEVRFIISDLMDTAEKSDLLSEMSDLGIGTIALHEMLEKAMVDQPLNFDKDKVERLSVEISSHLFQAFHTYDEYITIHKLYNLCLDSQLKLSRDHPKLEKHITSGDKPNPKSKGHKGVVNQHYTLEKLKNVLTSNLPFSKRLELFSEMITKEKQQHVPKKQTGWKNTLNKLNEVLNNFSNIRSSRVFSKLFKSAKNQIPREENIYRDFLTTADNHLQSSKTLSDNKITPPSKAPMECAH